MHIKWAWVCSPMPRFPNGLICFGGFFYLHEGMPIFWQNKWNSTGFTWILNISQWTIHLRRNRDEKCQRSKQHIRILTLLTLTLHQRSSTYFDRGNIDLHEFIFNKYHFHNARNCLYRPSFWARRWPLLKRQLSCLSHWIVEGSQLHGLSVESDRKDKIHARAAI